MTPPPRSPNSSSAHEHHSHPARPAPDTACIAFMMPNQGTKLAPFASYRIAVDSLEAAVGIDLFPQLSDELESKIEGDVDSPWSGLWD